jgi:membrane protein DedA with SNARE-associated domain
VRPRRHRLALLCGPSTSPLGVKAEMAKIALRTASIYCLAPWAAIWLLFLLMRLSPLDIRIIPGIGPAMLIALIVALMAPIVATGIAGAALVRQPRVSLNWVLLGCAITALIGQWILFTITRWL